MTERLAANLGWSIHAVRKKKIGGPLEDEERGVGAALGIAAVAELLDTIAAKRGV